MTVRLNQTNIAVPQDWLEEPLLWFLRDHAGLRATRFGCGVGVCGACVVHVDRTAMRSCQVPVRDVLGRHVVTLEGLAAGQPDGLHPVQRAWIEAAVPQCGYCQSGQIMTAAAALTQGQPPAGVRAAMDQVMCRCGTQPRIARALARLLGEG